MAVGRKEPSFGFFRLVFLAVISAQTIQVVYMAHLFAERAIEFGLAEFQVLRSTFFSLIFHAAIIANRDIGASINAIKCVTWKLL